MNVLDELLNKAIYGLTTMSEIKQEIKDLAADFLRELSNVQGNAGCNDWKFPESWTQQMKEEFTKGYHRYNNSPDDFDPDFLVLPDFAVTSYLAYLLDGKR